MAKAREEEIELLKSQIKGYIALSHNTLKGVASKLTEKYDKETLNNLSGKIRQGTIKHIEVLRIADVIGYELQWVKKES